MALPKALPFFVPVAVRLARIIAQASVVTLSRHHGRGQRPEGEGGYPALRAGGGGGRRGRPYIGRVTPRTAGQRQDLCHVTLLAFPECDKLATASTRRTLCDARPCSSTHLHPRPKDWDVKQGFMLLAID